ncbi:MAG: type I glutamate--ammonia ligase [Candidatus Micrarchaeota archaeon]
MDSIGKGEILKRAKDENVTLVNLQFSDMQGMAKAVTIPSTKLADALESGVWFDGSSVEGFTRIYESDMLLIPDLSTYSQIPWMSDENGSTARIICDVHMPDGKPFGGDPRYVLKKVLAEAKDAGYIYNTGPELEFFLFKKENGTIKTSADKKIEPHDRGQYFDLVLDLGFEVRREIISTLQKMGLDVEVSHHEVAPGQHEIGFKYGDALATADRAMTLKIVMKAIAAKHGLHATFMPKPLTGVNGNGMHVHQSLFTPAGENAFYDSSDKYKLSKIAYSFLGGQMKHVKAMAALLNPTVNSYKRLVPGYEAATYICWANQNRSALIRVPRYCPGKEKSTRMEIRCPDPSASPYLAFAVLLKAGLDGMKNNMAAPEPVEENVFEFDEAALERRKIDTLPHSLWQSLKALKEDPVICSVLGEDLLQKYLHAKTKEWDSFRTTVTDWETREYLERV